MDALQSLLLGAVQGLTEWLPVSSSGHLVVIQSVMGVSVPVAFDALLHLGTLLSVCAYFRKELTGIARAVARLDTGSDDLKTAILVLVGSFPAAIVGLLFREVFESFFTSLVAVGIGFLITAAMLAISKLGGKGSRGVGIRTALLVGAFQAAAIAPGISRSGLTISSALLAGTERASAFRFSFLLSIPAILGALAVELPALDPSLFGWQYLVGFAVSAAVGFASIGVVRRAVISDRFPAFSVYCLLAGVTTLLMQLL